MSLPVKGEMGRVFCVKHGGGFRCSVEGCSRSAIGGGSGERKCGQHGGGKRCEQQGCPKLAVADNNGNSKFCTAHGGGKRCRYPGCNNSALKRTNRTLCLSHADALPPGGKRDEFPAAAAAAAAAAAEKKPRVGGVEGVALPGAVAVAAPILAGHHHHHLAPVADPLAAHVAWAVEHIVRPSASGGVMAVAASVPFPMFPPPASSAPGAMFAYAPFLHRP